MLGLQFHDVSASVLTELLMVGTSENTVKVICTSAFLGGNNYVHKTTDQCSSMIVGYHTRPNKEPLLTVWNLSYTPTPRQEDSEHITQE